VAGEILARHRRSRVDRKPEARERKGKSATNQAAILEKNSGGRENKSGHRKMPGQGRL